jgi:ABC-2 type transport system ATP-binding protein
LDRFVDVQILNKRYGTFAALNNCDLSIDQGSIFGLLGPNGAGKTTLIRCLLGFIRPTSGQAHFDGLDCTTQSVQVRSRVAYLPAEARLFRMMRGSAVLEFFSEIHPGGSLDRSRKIADQLALDLSRRVAFMSTGMRQKLAIACVLACRTPLVILDEPTANLDPNVRSEVLALIRDVQKAGSTVLFSSHILSEIEEVCSTAAIMYRGRVIQTLDISKMRATHRVSGVPNKNAPLDVELNALTDVRLVENTQHRFTIEIAGSIQEHLAWLSTLPIHNMRIEPTGLKSVYESCCEFS